MRYYAVTEDPNELFHYGVKGMKWGQHIFGDKPKSPGYRKALGKLRASYQKSKEQRAITREQKRQDKYNKAVQKAQMRIQVTENLHTLDQMKSYQNDLNRQYRQDRNREKAASRLARKEARNEQRYAKNELKMDKYLQQARQGKLKYGKLSDDQVRAITDRLGMERSARSLGSAEKTWRQQKREAFRKGKLSGIERGTAAAMEEVARAGTIYGIQNFMNRRKLRAVAKQEGQEERIKNRERNKKTAKDIKKEIKQEAYESELRSGKGFLERGGFGTHMTVAKAASILKENENKKLEDDRVRKVQERISNERDEAFAKLIGDQGFKDEKSAFKGYVESLHEEERRISNQKGLASPEAVAARARANDAEKKFGKLSTEGKKQYMLKNEVKKKETESDNDLAKALKKMAQIASNSGKDSSGNPITFTAKEIRLLNALNINPYAKKK